VEASFDQIGLWPLIAQCEQQSGVHAQIGSRRRKLRISGEQ
jgi:hypothetical protein